METLTRRKLGFLLWSAGMVGVISLLPVLPSLVSNLSDGNLPPIWLLLVGTTLQTGLMLAVAVLIGLFLAPQVGLGAPVARAVVKRESVMAALRPQIRPGIVGGVIGGAGISVVAWLFLPLLPEEFIAAGRELSLPLPARMLYGGISEEILMRWGFMTLLVWLPYRFLKKRQGDPPAGYFVAAIALSAVVFGLGHLPVARVLSPVVTVPLVIYIVTANALFGFVAGFLYWRRGLESAMIAHMVAHIIMVSAEQLIY
jgi:hypothetical protein